MKNDKLNQAEKLLRQVLSQTIKDQELNTPEYSLLVAILNRLMILQKRNEDVKNYKQLDRLTNPKKDIDGKKYKYDSRGCIG